LFAHKTKAKQLNNFGEFRSNSDKNYSLICFNYIHQNPINSNLVDDLKDWDFSSYKDYVGLRNGTLVSKKLAIEILNLDLSIVTSSSRLEIREEDIKLIL